MLGDTLGLAAARFRSLLPLRTACAPDPKSLSTFGVRHCLARVLIGFLSIRLFVFTFGRYRMEAAADDEQVALELHKQLNAIPLRARRGHGQDPLAHQLSLDRQKRDRNSKPRIKRTTSSSQEHPSGKKQRTSEPDDPGHTSARARPTRRDPEDSNHSQQGGSDPRHDPKDEDLKHSDSGDSGMAAGPEARHQQLAGLVHDLDPLQLLQQCSQPIQAAATYAAHKAKQQALRQQAQSSGHVKVFYAGLRWALSLPHSAVKSRQLLAKALNDAFVGEILSVGQGEGLTVVFLDGSGKATEVGPTKWGSSKASSAQWRNLAKNAVRVYVR